MVQPSILVAQALEDKEYDTVVISKAADAMLAMSGIELVLFWLRTIKEIFQSLLVAEVGLTCNELWKSWVAVATLTWQQHA